jgi:hypothetical protein
VDKSAGSDGLQLLLEPCNPIGDLYEAFLKDLDNAIRARGDVRLVVGEDFNAWNVEWSSRCNNPRGELLSDFAASLGLALANSGDTPTFVRGEATSIIDVTFARGTQITYWEVLDNINLSDHACILFRNGALPLVPQPDGFRTVLEAKSTRIGP